MAELCFAPTDWLGMLRRDYLESFVAEGGSAVKVAVVARNGAAGLARSLLEEARGAGFVTACVDAATCKPHLVQQLFCEVARQIEWDRLAADFLRHNLPARGFRLPRTAGLT